MPTAPLRPCPQSGCSVLTIGGPCADHARAREQRRGTAHQRGYTYRHWSTFRPRFLAMLVDAGIAPVCGAALPDGPQTQHSQCHQDGLLTFTSADGSSLHLDHEPPLRQDERTNPDAVCDPQRIQLLCAACHARKTASESGALR